ncbi:MAG: serine/threonine phosphatase [Hydrococcus sp. C42_A2020_068]|nr:serine/threonine phosphatase [Hydrococcus sp. C42_A2020_068]
MLVCPQCQFENPNNNKFCQRCGTSLTHKSCHECGTGVSFSAQTCHKCGAFTGTVWLVIIVEQGEQKQQNLGEYLDLGRRYRLMSGEGGALSQVSNSKSLHKRFQGKVLDCQPLQKSVLGILLEQQAELLENSQENSTGERVSEAALWQRIGIPELALPYLTLKDSIAAVPTIHDAWHEEKKEVILLSDRSDWQLLSEQWREGRLPLEETISRLTEMATLWELLSQVNCQQSLLVESNLRSAKEQTFGLEQLYQTPQNTQLTLQDLGGVWQKLLQQSELTKFEPLTQLLNELASGAIATIEQLQLKLQALHRHATEARGRRRTPPRQPLPVKRRNGDKVSASGDRSQNNDADLSVIPSSSQTAPSGDRELEEAVERSSTMAPRGSSSGDREPTFSGTQAAVQAQTTVKSPLQSASLDEPTTDELVLASDEDEDSFDSASMRSVGQMTEGEDLSTAVLPMELQSLADAGYTDRGRQRHHNEDFFGLKSQVKKQLSSRGKKCQARGLYIVCDGMGGHAAGEVASAMAVETLQRYFIANWQDDLPDRETIEKGVLLANQAIFNVNQKNARSGNGRMGTTLVMALVQDTKVAIAHVGDSRIYRVSRKGGLEQLTVDHEVGQRAIQGGVDPNIAYARPDAYQLTQALGPHGSKFIQPDIRYLDLQEDTLLLLCSDGLSDNHLIETHWQTYLIPLISANNNLEKGLRKLIDFANQHNGHDNITAILVRMKVRPYLGGGTW